VEERLAVGDIALFPHTAGMSKSSVEEIYGIEPRIMVVINMTPELTGIDVMEPPTVVWPIERVQLIRSAALIAARPGREERRGLIVTPGA
jgi:hypothetical protein